MQTGKCANNENHILRWGYFLLSVHTVPWHKHVASHWLWQLKRAKEQRWQIYGFRLQQIVIAGLNLCHQTRTLISNEWVIVRIFSSPQDEVITKFCVRIFRAVVCLWYFLSYSSYTFISCGFTWKRFCTKSYDRGWCSLTGVLSLPIQIISPGFLHCIGIYKCHFLDGPQPSLRFLQVGLFSCVNMPSDNARHGNYKHNRATQWASCSTATELTELTVQ